jgi:ATP/ADP translocase
MPIHYVLAAVFASCFYVLIYLLQEWGHIFYYVLAAVFASCFYVLIYLLQEWGHIFYYVLAAVFASCFYVLFKIRFVSKGPKGGAL